MTVFLIFFLVALFFFILMLTGQFSGQAPGGDSKRRRSAWPEQNPLNPADPLGLEMFRHVPDTTNGTADGVSYDAAVSPAADYSGGGWDAGGGIQTGGGNDFGGFSGGGDFGGGGTGGDWGGTNS